MKCFEALPLAVFAMVLPYVVNAADFGNGHRDKRALPQTHSSYWVYYTGSTNQSKRPCVLIAVAGSGLFYGIKLTEEDVPEHLPYAETGFIVIAYGSAN